MLTNTDKAHSEFPQQYMDWKVSEDHTKDREMEFEAEYKFMQKPETFE